LRAQGLDLIILKLIHYTKRYIREDSLKSSLTVALRFYLSATAVRNEFTYFVY